MLSLFYVKECITNLPRTGEGLYYFKMYCEMKHNSFTEAHVICVISICLTDDWILSSFAGCVIQLILNANFSSHMVFSIYFSMINIHHAMICFVNWFPTRAYRNIIIIKIYFDVNFICNVLEISYIFLRSNLSGIYKK